MLENYHYFSHLPTYSHPYRIPEAASTSSSRPLGPTCPATPTAPGTKPACRLARGTAKPGECGIFPANPSRAQPPVSILRRHSAERAIDVITEVQKPLLPARITPLNPHTVPGPPAGISPSFSPIYTPGTPLTPHCSLLLGVLLLPSTSVLTSLIRILSCPDVVILPAYPRNATHASRPLAHCPIPFPARRRQARLWMGRVEDVRGEPGAAGRYWRLVSRDNGSFPWFLFFFVCQKVAPSVVPYIA